jgi:hypothetical protein
MAIKNVLTGEDNSKVGDNNDGENNDGAKYWWWLWVPEENIR